MKKRILLATAVIAASTICVGQAQPTKKEGTRSLLVISTFLRGVDFHELPITQRLRQDGWCTTAADITQISDSLLRQFQVAVVTDVRLQGRIGGPLAWSLKPVA